MESVFDWWQCGARGAGTRAAGMAAPGPALVQPVFLLNKSLPAVEEKDYSVAEIFALAERTAGFETVEGAQRTGGPWRLYAKDNEARIKLLLSGSILRGHYVQPHEKKTFIVRDANGEDREIATTKLFVGNIPLSFSKEDISKAVKKLKYALNYLTREAEMTTANLRGGRLTDDLFLSQSRLNHCQRKCQ